MKTSEYIAKRIEQRLKQLGIKKKDFAIMLGVQPSVINRWLSGDHNFTISTLERIQNALGICFFSFENSNIRCIPCKFIPMNQFKNG